MKVKSRKTKVKAKTRTTMRAPTKTKPNIEAELLALPTVTGGSIKTTLTIRDGLFAKAKMRAREMGVSFNAFVATALYDKLQHEPKTFSFLAPSFPPLPPTPPSPFRGRSLPGERWKEQHGEAYVVKAEYLPEGGGDVTVPWETAERYNRAVGQYPDANGDPQKLAKKLKLDIDTALACDILIGLPEFEAYMSDRYGVPTP